jgi:hypothetical protein
LDILVAVASYLKQLKGGRTFPQFQRVPFMVTWAEHHGSGSMYVMEEFLHHMVDRKQREREEGGGGQRKGTRGGRRREKEEKEEEEE